MCRGFAPSSVTPPSFVSFAVWAIDSMTAAAERIPSIRRQLLALLLVPAIVVLLAGTISDYATSIGPVRDAYDQALADAALAIATNLRMDSSGSVTLELPAPAIALLRSDAVDSI